jgi:hypothetical protein
MTKSNLVELKDFREIKSNRDGKENYQRYLATLSNFQLEAEINGLLKEFSQEGFEKKIPYKIDLIQDEIISRADENWKIRIQELKQSYKNFPWH